MSGLLNNSVRVYPIKLNIGMLVHKNIFLDICRCAFKIDIETGNIFFNNLDTNESICDFFQKQENIEKVNIHSGEFTFTDSYEDYFEWLVHGFKQGDDQKYDVLANKNSKYLFNRFKDYL